MNAASEPVAILGVEPRSLGIAAAFSVRGRPVRLFDPDPDVVDPLSSAGGVSIDGTVGDDSVTFELVTADISGALSNCRTIICCSAPSQQYEMARLALPFVETGAVYLLAEGCAGSLAIRPLFDEAGLDINEGVILGETSNMPYSGRMRGPTTVKTRGPNKVGLAAFPARNNERLYDRLKDEISFTRAPNILATALNNVNIVIHPGPMLLNYAAMERTSGDLSLMNEGMTPGVLELIDGLDAERLNLVSELGFDPKSIDDLYLEIGSHPRVYREKGEPFGLRDQIHRRYISEDTPYGTVMLSSLGGLLSVPTPISDSINTLLSVVDGVDYHQDGRTVDRLGLGGLTSQGIRSYLETGEKII